MTCPDLALPPHWRTARLRFVADINPLPPPRSDLPDDLEVSFLAMESIGEDGRLHRDTQRPAGDVRTGYSYFEDGDVAFAKVTPCFENGKGALMSGLVGSVGFGTTELTVLRPRAGLNARFLNYFVTSSHFRGPAAGAMTGAGGLKRVPEEFTRNTLVPLPPSTVQAAIADYLDREAARIDALIEKKSRFIELLREKRQALITQAVTRGLDPGVPLMESGVDHLGLVPNHWSITKVKRLLRQIGQGWSPECEAREPAEGEWGVLKVGCVNGGIFRESESKTLPADLPPRPELALKRGDVLVSRANTRELVGSCAVVPADFPRLMLCDKLYRLVPNERVLPAFLAQLITVHGRRQVEIEATGASASMVNIAQNTLLDLEVAMPSLEEQQRIVEATAARSSLLMRIEELTTSGVDLLRERRAALITAAVTGQIDVREAA